MALRAYVGIPGRIAISDVSVGALCIHGQHYTQKYAVSEK